MIEILSTFIFAVALKIIFDAVVNIIIRFKKCKFKINLNLRKVVIVIEKKK